MEFLEMMDRLNVEEASTERLYGGEGASIRTLSRRSPEYQGRVVSLVKLFADVQQGRRRSYWLREAMTTDDFPYLFGDIIDRTVLATYRAWPLSWPQIAQRRVVNDFRSVKMFPPVIGADGRLGAVGEREEYPETKLDESAALTFAVAKFGRRISFSWEAMINDDLDQLKNVPDRFARAAARTEERFVTELFVDVNGPHASLYTAGNKNVVNVANGAAANNPPLSIAGLQDAFTVLAKMLDDTGEPILRETVTLLVPPALEITANNILNATQLELSAAAAGEPATGARNSQKLWVANWMRNRLRLVVNPYIPLTAITANGNTSWFLIADPNGADRPAAVVGFLRGHETPEIFIREPNQRRVGGGVADPMNGSFETDSIDYKVRHVVGGRFVDGRATVASNGSGA